MNIGRLDSETVIIESIDPFFAMLLHRLSDAMNPGDDAAAHERLFSRPEENPSAEFAEMWREQVEPELRHLFQSATETVLEDLKQIPEMSENLADLKIPVKHLDAWLNCLNRARLVLVERHRFTEEELSREPSLGIQTERDLILFQVQIYGFLQEMFIQQITGSD